MILEESDVYKLLRNRASKLKIISYIFLLTILGLIFFSGYVFFYADDITKVDLSKSINNKIGNITKLYLDKKDELKELESKINIDRTNEKSVYLEGRKKAWEILDIYKYESEILNKEINTHTELMQTHDIDYYYKKEDKKYFFDIPLRVEVRDNFTLLKRIKNRELEINKIFQQLKIIFKEYSILHNINKEKHNKLNNKYQESIKKIKIKINEYELGINLMNEELFKEKYSSVNADNKLVIDSKQMIQTNITRFETLILIIFLVNILINLYRYNIRLSVYYDSRADSLLLLYQNIDSDNYAKLAETMNPQILDFGKNIIYPTTQALEMLKSTINKTKNKN